MFTFKKSAGLVLALTLGMSGLAYAQSPQSGVYTGYVGADDQNFYEAVFVGGRPARVGLIGAGSDIDLWIYDEHGRLVCKSTSYDSVEGCEWIPPYTQTYTIRVENLDKPRGSQFDIIVA